MLTASSQAANTDSSVSSWLGVVQVIKQADVVLLGYPLGYPGLTTEVRERELLYYGNRTDSQGPAMTWGMHAIGFLDLGESGRR